MVGVSVGGTGVLVGTRITVYVGTTTVAVIVGDTGILVLVAVDVAVLVAVGTGVAASLVVGVGFGATSKLGPFGVAALVGSKATVGRTVAGSVAEAVTVGVRDAGAVGVASGLVTVPISGVLLTVAVICWPAAITSSSSSTVTWVVPVSVSIWVCVAESTSTVSLVYFTEATAAVVRTSNRSASASGVLTSWLVLPL